MTAEVHSSINEIRQQLEQKESKIRELEEQLRLRNNEISELRSQLDKFQSVFPFSNPVSPTLNHHYANNNNNNNHFTISNNNFGRPRKQRAQGISAEPQTIHDLSQKKFPTYPKDDRYVLFYYFDKFHL